MNHEARPAEPAECPYLVPVTGDFLWLYPHGAYCRRPDGRVRVPGAGTVALTCATHAHLVCPGYVDSGRASPSQGEAAPPS